MQMILRLVRRIQTSRGCHATSTESTSTTPKSLEVNSFNVVTEDKNRLRLTYRPGVSARKVARLYKPPAEAIRGLRNVMVELDVAPKLIQYNADQLTNKILHRQMPADPEEVKRARREKQMRHYKWKPTAFSSRADCAGYALSRLLANYAEARFVLDQLDATACRPHSVLDYGSGVGGVFWAVRDKWDAHMQEYSAVDPSAEVAQCAMDIMRGTHPDSPALIAPYVNFRRSIVPSPKHTYDVVIAQRVLPEMPSQKSRFDLISMLWQRTNKYLVLIESSLKDHFSSLMQVRDFLLTVPYRFDRQALMSQLDSEGALTEELAGIVMDGRASPVERFRLLKAKGIRPETELDSGYVFAPCPHDSGCPLFNGRDFSESCQFEAPFPEVRVDGKSKCSNENRTLRTKFSYLIMAKGQRPSMESPARVTKVNNCGRHVQCEVCTAFNGLQRFTASKKMGPQYSTFKGLKQGQELPFKDELISSSNEEVDLIQKLYNEEKQRILG